MSSLDKTQVFAAPPVRIRVKRGKLIKGPERLAFGFNIGRGDTNDVQFADKNVSSNHAAVFWEDGAWWLKDAGSKNGTYVNGERILDKVTLPVGVDVSLALDGPVIVFEIEDQTLRPGTKIADDPRGLTQVVQRYFEGAGSATAGERTRMIFQAYQKVKQKHSKRYKLVIGVISVLLLCAVGAVVYYQQRVKKLELLHATAENVFYATKSLELQVAKLQSAVEQTSDPEIKKQFQEKLKEQRGLQARYEDFLDELGISKGKLTEEEWLIYKVARLFGECDVSMPKGFVETVKQYIRYWQATPRFREAIERARVHHYAPRIVHALLANDMPPQFFYLALQESDFDTQRCGPQTYAGIAKGMWQFIPQTAIKYGLQTGPLIDLRKPDPLDERQNVDKSTFAAARYLRDLYQTEAQASGLLVMACYNWNENKVREMLSRMPENPRERNFWKILNENKFPQETYDYVFYIMSAAVIGENPRLFGFDFDDPIDSKDIDSQGTASR